MIDKEKKILREPDREGRLRMYLEKENGQKHMKKHYLKALTRFIIFFVSILLFLFILDYYILPPKTVYVPITKTVTVIKEVKVPAVVVQQHDNKIIIQPTIKSCQKYLLHEDNEMDKGEKLAHECYR